MLQYKLNKDIYNALKIVVDKKGAKPLSDYITLDTLEDFLAQDDSNFTILLEMCSRAQFRKFYDELKNIVSRINNEVLRYTPPDGGHELNLYNIRARIAKTLVYLKAKCDY